MALYCGRLNYNRQVYRTISSIAKPLCNGKQLKEDVDILLTTHKHPHADEDCYTYFRLLQVCTSSKALSEGKLIHSHIITTFVQNTLLQNTLINMYYKCGSVEDARRVFDRMAEPTVFSWNLIIAAYRRHGFPHHALSLFHQMLRTAIQPNDFTFSNILPVCSSLASLEQGLQIHGKIITSGIGSNVIVMNALIDMYGKCGSLSNAGTLFDKMRQRDVVSWNALIAGYEQNGLFEKALKVFKQMQLGSVKADSASFAIILPACAAIGALEQGMEIHQKIIQSGFLSYLAVANALIDMYAKCGSIHGAQEVFDEMGQPNKVSWNTLIGGYAQNELLEKALDVFKQMQYAGVKPDSATFTTIFSTCSKMGALEQGIEIHSQIVEDRFLSDVRVVTALIDMYGKCGDIQKAEELFDKMPQRNVVSWNAIILGYVQNGFLGKALEIYRQMQLAGIKPISSTFASILPVCGKMGALEQGVKIHQEIVENGFSSDVVVMTSLMDMYAKCGSIEKAQELFEKMPQRNVISWSSIIAGYAQNGPVEKALEIFKRMEVENVKPNSATFASILPACAELGALQQGMEIHQKIIKSRSLSDVVVANALLDMYAKCGTIQKARVLFEKMPDRNVVCWNAMITGCAQNGDLGDALRLFKEMPQQDVVSWTAIISGHTQNGLFDKALEMFKQMRSADVKPNASTFVSILPACAKLGALEQGLEIHKEILEDGLLSDKVVTALIDMYAKCGSIRKARDLFDDMHNPDVTAWNAIISGYAINGYSKDALKLFELMKCSGTNPNHISLVCVLFACSHACLVDNGCKYFNHMIDSYFISPTIDHYVCMVDLLGRAGYLEEAVIFIIKMTIKSHAILWMCLLGACRSHKNICLGEFVARLLFELDPKNAAPYVALSNICAEVGRWGEVQKVRKLMKEMGIKKVPGCSWIEVHKIVHVFRVGDRSHPQTQEIYEKLEKLSWEMRVAAYIPDIRSALNDVEDEEKELLLGHHSEKLAIAFCLLNTPPGTTIRVVKNLRVCDDCHAATKFISMVVAREIVVRDANRFHHFKDGHCSCEDYW